MRSQENEDRAQEAPLNQAVQQLTDETRAHIREQNAGGEWGKAVEATLE